MGQLEPTERVRDTEAFHSSLSCRSPAEGVVSCGCRWLLLSLAVSEDSVLKEGRPSLLLFFLPTISHHATVCPFVFRCECVFLGLGLDSVSADCYFVTWVINSYLIN